jgi:hypothetical protein
MLKYFSSRSSQFASVNAFNFTFNLPDPLSFYFFSIALHDRHHHHNFLAAYQSLVKPDQTHRQEYAGGWAVNILI